MIMKLSGVSPSVVAAIVKETVFQARPDVSWFTGVLYFVLYFNP
jgi:hypothetical protein